jgi:hypothetical protein
MPGSVARKMGRWQGGFRAASALARELALIP